MDCQLHRPRARLGAAPRPGELAGADVGDGGSALQSTVLRAVAAAKLDAEKVAASEIVAELKQQLAEAEAQERALE